MTKPAAKNVTVGMVYEIIAHDDLLAIGMRGATDFNPPIGTHVEIVNEPYGTQGRVVDWVIVGQSTIYTSFWGLFRDNTELRTGKPKPTNPVALTNPTGQFAGFDITVKKTKIEDYTDGMGFGEISIVFGFDGSFTGKKKLPTVLINQIKNTPGFKAHVLDLTHREITKHQTEITDILKNATEKQDDAFTWYTNGGVELTVRIANSLNTIHENAEKQLETFIQAKKTHTSFHNQK